MSVTASDFAQTFSRLSAALRTAGFRGDVERDTALRAAMSTDNSVYQIVPDLVIAPKNADDVVVLMSVLEKPAFAQLPVTARGGGTGTNGQSLNRGIILDMRRHMHRLIAVDPEGQWADVEPGMVLDELNDQLRGLGLFFAPETSTSTRCTIGGMVSTDASGKGSRVYGKTSDNLLGIEIARGTGLVSSFGPVPDWAKPMLAAAEKAARGGRAAFVENTPRLNRRFTGYDLERACRDTGGFEWWHLFPGSEGTLGPITRIRVKLRRRPREKQLIVAGFASFRQSLAAAMPLLTDEPTAIEVMDERVQALANEAGLLLRLPQALRPQSGDAVAYTFVEFNGDDEDDLSARVSACERRIRDLPGVLAVHVAREPEDIRELWAVRSAGVGLLGKVEGRARPVAFVEDCVVPPEKLPKFLDGFLSILARHGLEFGIYGHVDVGCLHIRPALDLDAETDRAKLVQVSDEIFDLVTQHGGIFWGEHGKGVRGAYLKEWIGDEAYAALQGVKAAFDPSDRFNPGKLVTTAGEVMGIATTQFRPFNVEAGDKLEMAFRCNGNAQCLSYSASTPMCPSFKATGDIRHSPKGRADALRAWHKGRRAGQPTVAEADLLATLNTCLGCKACSSSCPVQVDIPTMRASFYADYFNRNRRPLADRLTMMAERMSPLLVQVAPFLRPVWPMALALAEWVMKVEELPRSLARPQPSEARIAVRDLADGDLPEKAVLVWMDWFSALFDEAAQTDVRRGLSALGYQPLFVEMRPAGKVAGDLGDFEAFRRMATELVSHLRAGAAREVPMIGLDPAFVMALRQDYLKAGYDAPKVLLVQEFLASEVRRGVSMPMVSGGNLSLFTHCTESTGAIQARQDWLTVLSAVGITGDAPETGCCGMAGLFGHKTCHLDTSRKLFDMSWALPLSDAGNAAATGFSCRCQSERLTGRNLRHPLGLIADHLAETKK